MRAKTGPNGSADRHVKEIKRKTRRQFSAGEKIRFVLDGLRGESSISEQSDAHSNLPQSERGEPSNTNPR